MSSLTGFDDIIDILRRTSTEALDHFNSILTRSTINSMEVNSLSFVGPKDSRIGVFGPYTTRGKRVISTLAKKISRLGFAAITGKGFYLPNQPRDFHNIEELMSPMDKLVKKAVPPHIFFYHLPLLTEKATFFMNTERGQNDELRGCEHYGIPKLGFILHDDTVAPSSCRKRNCHFLQIESHLSRCMVPTKDMCPYYLARLFCPFYDSIDVSWTSKSLFMGDDDALIAGHALRNTYPKIQSFIR